MKDTLAEKSRRALVVTGHRRLVVAGGVGANRKLRERLAAIAADNSAELYFPRTEFCTDNGAMIALAGALRAQAAVAPGAAGENGVTAHGALRGELPLRGLALRARANWPLEDDKSRGS